MIERGRHLVVIFSIVCNLLRDGSCEIFVTGYHISTCLMFFREYADNYRYGRDNFGE